MAVHPHPLRRTLPTCGAFGRSGAVCPKAAGGSDARDVRLSMIPTTRATEQQAGNERAVLQAVPNSSCGTDVWFEGALLDAAPDSPEG
jgi:hypothetical protein